jgi:competence protein ComEA
MHRIFRQRRLAVAIVTALALLAAAAASPSLAAGPADNKSGAASSKQKIDINRAGTEELATIPGIGKSLAQRIVDFRDEHGAFTRVEDLLKVKGIGEKSFQKIRPHVKVSQPR